MTRDKLEHIIRASGDITDQYEFMVIGSQSILGPVSKMPMDVEQQRRLRATIRRWSGLSIMNISADSSSSK